MEVSTTAHDIASSVRQALKRAEVGSADEAVELLFSLKDDPQLASAFEHEWRQWSAGRPLFDYCLARFVLALARFHYPFPGLWSSLLLIGNPGDSQAREFGSLLQALKPGQVADAKLVATQAMAIVSSRWAQDKWVDTLRDLANFINVHGLFEAVGDRLLQLVGTFSQPVKGKGFNQIALPFANQLNASQWTAAFAAAIESNASHTDADISVALSRVDRVDALPHDAVQRYLAHMAQRPESNEWTRYAFKCNAVTQCVLAVVYAGPQPNVSLRHALEAVPQCVARLVAGILESASPSKWGDALKIAEAVSSDVRRREIIAAVSLSVSEDRLVPSNVPAWIDWAANASATSHALLLAELADAMYLSMGAEQWKVVIETVLSSHPEKAEPALAKVLAVFAKPGLNRLIVSQELIKSMIAHLFAMGPSGMLLMPPLFRAGGVASQTCGVFFTDPPAGLDLWRALEVRGFMGALATAAMRQRLFDRVPVLINYLVEHPRAWAPDSIAELAQAVIRGDAPLEECDWDNLVNLVCLLSADDASRTVIWICKDLKKFGSMTPDHARRLQSCARSLTSLAYLKLFMNLAESVEASVLSDGWESALRAAVSLPLSEVDLAIDFAKCVLVPTRAEIPQEWISAVLDQLLVPGTLQAAVVATFGADIAPRKAIWDKLSGQTKSLAALAANERAVVNLWKVAPDLWAHMPVITTIVPSDKLTLWAIEQVWVLCWRKIGTPSAWIFAQDLLQHVPHGDQLALALVIRVALEEGAAGGWCTVKPAVVDGLKPLLNKRSVEDWGAVVRFAMSSQKTGLYREALFRALNSGLLAWERSPLIASHRALLRASDTSINWDCVFFGRPPAGAGNAGDLILCRFSTSPVLAPVLETWVEAIRAAALSVVGWQARLGQDQKKPVSDKLQVLLRVLLNMVRGGSDKSIESWKLAPKTGFTYLITQALGAEGESVLVREEILKGIVELQDKKFRLKRTLQQSIDALLELAHKADARVAETLAQAHTSLQLVVGAANFKAMFDTFYFYTAEILNKDSLECLWLGQDVSCCLSPTGLKKAELLDRLVGPWVLVAVKNGRGEVVATAWCVLCKEDQDHATVLVCDFVDSRPSLRMQVKGPGGRDVMCPDGRLVLDNLLGVALERAQAAVGAARLYVAWPIPYGRILGYAPRGSDGARRAGRLKVLGPNFLAEPYVDSIKRDDATYYRL